MADYFNPGAGDGVSLYDDFGGPSNDTSYEGISLYDDFDSDYAYNGDDYFTNDDWFETSDDGWNFSESDNVDFFGDREYGNDYSNVDSRLDSFFNKYDSNEEDGGWGSGLLNWMGGKQGTSTIGGLATGLLGAWQSERSIDRAERLAEQNRQHDKDMAILMASLKKSGGGGGGSTVSSNSTADPSQKGTFTKRA